MVKVESQLSKWTGIPGDGPRETQPRTHEERDEQGNVYKQTVWVGADGRVYATGKSTSYADSKGHYGFPDDVGLLEWSVLCKRAGITEAALDKLRSTDAAAWAKGRVVWLASGATGDAAAQDAARRFTAYRIIHDVLVEPKRRPGSYVSLRRAPSDLDVAWNVWERARFLVVDHCWLDMDGARVHRLADLLTARPDGASVVLLGARFPARTLSQHWARVCSVLAEDRAIRLEVA